MNTKRDFVIVDLVYAGEKTRVYAHYEHHTNPGHPDHPDWGTDEFEPQVILTDDSKLYAGPLPEDFWPLVEARARGLINSGVDAEITFEDGEAV